MIRCHVGSSSVASLLHGVAAANPSSATPDRGGGEGLLGEARPAKNSRRNDCAGLRAPAGGTGSVHDCVLRECSIGCGVGTSMSVCIFRKPVLGCIEADFCS